MTLDSEENKYKCLSTWELLFVLPNCFPNFLWIAFLKFRLTFSSLAYWQVPSKAWNSYPNDFFGALLTKWQGTHSVLLVPGEERQFKWMVPFENE